MNHSDRVFLTGATGTLGASLLLRLLETGRSCRVLVRPKPGESGAERIDRQLRRLGCDSQTAAAYLDRIETVEGDMSVERFGLSEGAYRRAGRNLEAIIHAAAFVDFQGAEEQPFQSANVDGTRNALDLAERTGAPFMHLSTAYVNHGEGIRREEVASQGRNHYERTKQSAERLVRDALSQKGGPYCVVRPSILFGAFADGRSLCFKNFYQFLRLLDVYLHSATATGAGRPLTLALDANAALNLMPIDLAADSITEIFQRTNWDGETFHITNPKPPTLGEIAALLSSLHDFPIVLDLEAEAPRSASARLERAANELLRPFRDYLRGEPRFDVESTERLVPGYANRAPALDRAYFQRVLSYARSVRWGSGRGPGTPANGRTSGLDFTNDYFQNFLTAKTGLPLVEGLENLHARFEIIVDDLPDSDWRIEIQSGVLRSVDRGGGEVQVQYHLSSNTFREIVAGRRSPQQAFFDRQVEIKGDIESGLNTAVALAEFFSRFPYRPTPVSGHEPAAV